MTVRPTICVGVLTRNHEQFVTQAIRSIAEQKTLPDGIIFVDNASDDDTVALAQHALESIDACTVRFVQNSTNSNASGGLRQLLTIASGKYDYLAVLHGDDMMRVDYISSMQARILQFPGRDTALNVARIDIATDGRIRPRGRRPLRWSRSQLANRLGVRFANMGSMPGALLPVEVTIEQGRLGHPTETCCTEDWLLWQRLANAGVRLVALEEPLIFYRIHDGGSGGDSRRCRALGLARGCAIAEAATLFQKSLAKLGACLDEPASTGQYVLGLQDGGISRAESTELLNDSARASRVILARAVRALLWLISSPKLP